MLNERQEKEVAKSFDGVRWDELSESSKRLLGRWRADEKRYMETGEITVLYNERCPLQVVGRVVCGGYAPLTESRIELISKRLWKKKLKGGEFYDFW